MKTLFTYLFFLFTFHFVVSAQDAQLSEEYIIGKNESVEDKISRNIFVRIEVSKKKCFVGESIVATYKLYTRLKSESKIVKRPSFNGFSVYDMHEVESSEARTEYFNGKQFNVYILRQVQLFPLQAGTFFLESMEVENQVSFLQLDDVRHSKSMEEIIHGFSTMELGQESFVNKTMTISSGSESIIVQPLPASAPSSFNGAVGSFQIKFRIVEKEVHEHDIAHLQIAVIGNGNFPVLNQPDIHRSNDIDVFDAEITEKYDVLKSPMQGYKMFTIPFSPKKQGELKLPVVVFSFFDPSKKKFIADSIGGDAITILKGNHTETDDRLQKNKAPFSPIRILGIAFLILSSMLIAFRILKKKENFKKGSALLQKGPPLLFIEGDNTLALLLKSVEKNDVQGFYKLAEKAIHHHLNKKYHIVNEEEWKLKLNEKLNDAEWNELKEIKELIARKLYAPLSEDSDMKKDYDRIRKMVNH